MMSSEEVIKLLNWFDSNRRDLPWRRTTDPYGIWVSEIMLQQTRVEAVKPYYSRFLSKYPDVRALSKASDEDLVRIWEGLGYYSRVRNMHKAAMEVVYHHGGLFPISYEVLKTLPGIGEYTAGAVSSIAGGENVPAVDGNVLRVYTRRNADPEEITSAKCVKRIRQELQTVMNQASKECGEVYTPGKFNSAMMELGAIVCVPKGEPLCDRCPLKDTCLAKRQGNMGEYPRKAPKAGRRIEERTIFIMESTAGIALKKRPGQGLLAGMYEFPGTEGYLNEAQAKEYLENMGYHPLRIRRAEDAKHIFSHVEWHMRAYLCRVDDLTDPVKEDPENAIRFVTKKEREKGFALPSAFSAYKKYI